MEEKFVRMCEGLYYGVETRVAMNATKSRWFDVARGLGKGDRCLYFYLIFI